MVLEGPPERRSPETEILLFTAARRDHLERVIRPALARGAVVICDRFADSTRVYQGTTRGDLRGLVDALHAQVIAQEPDLTLLIDIDPAEGLARAAARAGGEQRFESFGLQMSRVMRAAFLDLAAAAPQRIALIDGARDAGSIAGEIEARVLPRLEAP